MKIGLRDAIKYSYKKTTAGLGESFRGFIEEEEPSLLGIGIALEAIAFPTIFGANVGRELYRQHKNLEYQRT